MSAVKSSILSSLTGVKDKMKLGLGGVDKDVEKTQDHQESQQEEVRAALEKIVKDQVGLLLGQIQILNDNAAKQQEQSQQEMQILKDSLKEQLNEIKDDNQKELAKIKEDLIETMDAKTAAAREKNDDQSKKLKSEIQDVLQDMNKQLVQQTDGQIDQLKAQIDEKYGEV